jgi:hypothetical protein
MLKGLLLRLRLRDFPVVVRGTDQFGRPVAKGLQYPGLLRRLRGRFERRPATVLKITPKSANHTQVKDNEYPQKPVTTGFVRL